jgi:hypothetical protein
MCDHQKLLDYIAIHDASCPNCLTNIRGQVEDVCPVCDSRLHYANVRSCHVAFGDSRNEPVCKPGLSHLQRIASYLESNDAPCPLCFRNLRGQPGPACPACDTKILFKDLYFAHRAYGDSGSKRMPVPGSAEAQRLDVYLAKNTAGCPSCGYELHGLVSDACPECGFKINLEALMFPEPKPARLYSAGVNILTTLSAAPIVIVMLFAVVQALNFMPLDYFFPFLITLGILSSLLYFFVSPGRRLLHKSLWWGLLLNPIFSVAGIYVALVISFVAFY